MLDYGAQWVNFVQNAALAGPPSPPPLPPGFKDFDPSNVTTVVVIWWKVFLIFDYLAIALMALTKYLKVTHKVFICQIISTITACKFTVTYHTLLTNILKHYLIIIF